MYQGVFMGDSAVGRKPRILILGESHHVAEKPIESTQSVVKDYLKNPNGSSYHFFDKIVASFGCDQQERKSFWEQMYFGNYIPEECGVGDKRAAIYLSNRDHRIACNDDLFRFVNHHGIDIVCCFSRLVYNKLPSLAAGEVEQVLYESSLGRFPDRLYHCVYQPKVSHRHTGVELTKPLAVYGMRHPSARCGYHPEGYREILAQLYTAMG